jgi:predicted PurR-regulated permease PerM
MIGPKLTYWILILTALGVMLWLAKPFLTPLVFAAVVAYLIYPAHIWLSERLRKELSAGMLTIIAITCIGTFLFYGASFLTEEVARIYMLFSKLDWSQFFPGDPSVAAAFKGFIQQVSYQLMDGLSRLTVKIPYAFISLLLFFIALFFFLLDGLKAWSWLEKTLPLPKSGKKTIIANIKSYIYAFLKVWLLIGVGQFFVALTGFYIFGLPYPWLAAFAAMILSILPIIGPYALYIPVGAITILHGNIWTGIGLLIYGLTLGSILDYVLRPYFAGKWSKMHPFFLFIGIFGGITLLGPAGFIVGPVLILVATALLKDAEALKESHEVKE